MTDIRAGDEVELDEDHLPWLEAVEEEDERSGPSLLKIIVSIIIGLIILGLVISGFYWLRTRWEAGQPFSLAPSPAARSLTIHGSGFRADSNFWSRSPTASRSQTSTVTLIIGYAPAAPTPRRCAPACAWPAKTAFRSTEDSMQ